MNKITKIFGILILGLLSYSGLQAQTDWGITAEEKAEKLKIPFTEANQEAGAEVFNKNCKICHNEIFIAPKNERKLPLSPNLGSQEIQSSNTDGELFHKFTKGHIATGMPPFGHLSEDDRWKIVTYLRTFYPDYKPTEVSNIAAPAAEKFKGKVKDISLRLDTATNTVYAKLTAVDTAGNSVNAKNVKVDIYIKRTFGSLLLGSAKTDENSIAKVACPPEIPADTNGYITISATMADSSAFTSINVEFGEKLHFVNPLDTPALWGTRANAPLWLKLTYLSVVIGVWLTIGWAAFQVVRIYNLRER